MRLELNKNKNKMFWKFANFLLNLKGGERATGNENVQQKHWIKE